MNVLNTDRRATSAEMRTGGAQSIHRAIAMLQAVAGINERGASVAELASLTGLERSTAHRILKCLAETGMLVSVGEPWRYFLGPLAVELGRVAHQRMDLRQFCDPALTRIAAESGDTVFLMVRDGYDSVCAERKSGSYPVKTFVVDVGTRRPLGVGAGSMAILSALPPDEINLCLDLNKSRIGEYPKMSAALLRDMAHGCRHSRKASMEVVGVEGVHAVAVPLCGQSGNPIGAFSIAAVNSRMTSSRRLTLFNILEREAAQLSQQLAKQGWLL